MRILLSGSSGVIGTHLQAMIESDSDLELAGAAHRSRFFDDSVSGDVLIDFSHPELTVRSLETAVRLNIPAVIGTTGLNSACAAAIDRAATQIPVCAAANFSLGVTVLLELAGRTAAALGPEFEVEIGEIHHRRKLDVPSGTALALGEAVAAGRRLDLATIRVDDRSQRRAPRQSGEIGFQAVRGGDVAGEHTVYFLGEGERVELIHRATDRRIFARGALLAAKKIVNRRPGRVDFAELALAHP